MAKKLLVFLKIKVTGNATMNNLYHRQFKNFFFQKNSTFWVQMNVVHKIHFNQIGQFPQSTDVLVFKPSYQVSVTQWRNIHVTEINAFSLIKLTLSWYSCHFPRLVQLNGEMFILLKYILFSYHKYDIDTADMINIITSVIMVFPKFVILLFRFFHFAFCRMSPACPFHYILLF